MDETNEILIVKQPKKDEYTIFRNNDYHTHCDDSKAVIKELATLTREVGPISISYAECI